MFGERLGKVYSGTEGARQQGGFPWYTTNNSSIDQQHRTTFCALKLAGSSYKPTIFMDSGFLDHISLEILEGGASSLLDG